MKSKAKPAAAPAAPAPLVVTNALADLADELGALEKEMLPYAMKMARIDALRRAIRGHYDREEASRAFQISGSRFAVSIGPRATERRIDEVALVKRIGLKVYASIARCTLTAIEKAVAPDVVAAVVSAAQTGTRPIKTFELGLPG